MNKFSHKKAYSIAEALMTLLIVALVFIAAAPSLSKRKNHINKIFSFGKHDIYTCKGQTCTFNPPEGVKDVFIIASSGGGGGAGSVCGQEITTYAGTIENDVTGTISPNGVMKAEATAGGGASCQGMCEKYPYGKYNPTTHTRECKIYSNAYYTTMEDVEQFEEVYNTETKKWESISKGFKKEEVKHYLTCDYNRSVPSECSKAVLGSPNYGSACGKTWVHKPEIGDGDRYCNQAVFGPCGGNGGAASATFCAWRNTCLKRDERGKCKIEETPQSIPYKIGGSGKKDGRKSANPLKFGSYMNLAGGGGCAGGPESSGEDVPGAGGDHKGMSRAYSAIPVPNTQNGGIGQIVISENYIMWGGGGTQGETKAGYFKNITGPIVMSAGKGGNGGASNGQDGNKTVVRAQKGGFSINTSTVYTGTNLTDKGNGTLLEVEGGKGGTQHKYYESCSSGENFYGTLHGGEHYNRYSNGGNGGEGGNVPGCPQTIGEDGKDGMVIIFY